MTNRTQPPAPDSHRIPAHAFPVRRNTDRRCLLPMEWLTSTQHNAGRRRDWVSQQRWSSSSLPHLRPPSSTRSNRLLTPVLRLLSTPRVDHRRVHILVPEQLLHGPNVAPVLEQMRREGVAECVTRRLLGNSSSADRIPHGTRQHRLVQMVDPFLTPGELTWRTPACRFYSRPYDGIVRGESPPGALERDSTPTLRRPID